MKPMEYDVVVLTEDRYAYPREVSDYVKNVLVEDALLVNALNKLGLRVGRFSWSDKKINWEKVRSVVFRTTWDYFDRYTEFKSWFDQLRENVIMFNHADVLEWNQDKIYLQGLSQKGIHIPETLFVKKGDNRSLAEVVEGLSDDEFVLKPNISGAARHTYRLQKSDCRSFESKYQGLIAAEDFMVQIFQKQIMTKGEISLVLIGGEYTHAVLKKGQPGDFRVQDDFGGTIYDYEADDEEILFARRCYDSMEVKPHYCRVDLIWDNDGKLALSELEMIEPELWFRKCPDAAEKLAACIYGTLSK